MASLTGAASLVTSASVSFSVTLLCLRWWVEAARRVKLVGRDMNKLEPREVPEAGGVWVAIGLSFGVLTLIAMRRYLEGSSDSESYMALALLLLLAGFLGFLDDILGWKRGLRAWQRVAFTAPLAIPLVVIKAGTSVIDLPLAGPTDLGLLYPLAAVPLGVVGASNAFNMIAGYNGLEAGMGLLLCVFLAAFSLVKGLELPLVGSILAASSLAAFLLYNRYPARVFPGNSLTYGFGAYYASLVILGNLEKFGLALFSLYFVELALFLRGLANGVYKENFGIPRPDGSLDPPYDKIYSLTHAALVALRRLRGRATERGVVAFILSLQAVVGALALLTLT
ncbi:MAG: hypothetical protein QXU97_00600 [Fervidicoccaceae archaeon]